MYEKDVVTSYQLIRRLLENQAEQTDFGLAVAADSSFTGTGWFKPVYRLAGSCAQFCGLGLFRNLMLLALDKLGIRPRYHVSRV